LPPKPHEEEVLFRNVVLPFGEEERTKENPRYISTVVYRYSTIAITGK
jgi:hypothetical protein